MKPIAKIDCKINNKFYSKGDEIEGIDTKEKLLKLLEKGFIESLDIKNIENFENEKGGIKKWD